MTISKNNKPLVKGEIVFKKDISSFTNATVYVLLKDVSLLDAPLTVIAEQIISNISHTKGTEKKLEFALFHNDRPDERASYSIYVHKSLHKDRQIHSGDYITMQSYPVLTFGYPDQVLIQLQKVRQAHRPL